MTAATVEDTQDNTQVITDFKERLAKADKTVKYYALGNAVVGFIPLPIIDMVAMTAVQLKMLHSLSNLYGIPFTTEVAKSAISSLIGGVLPVQYAGPVAFSTAKVVPVVGTGIAYATLPVFSGAATYAVGKVFIQHFESGGTFLTFDPEKVRDYFAQQMKEGEKLVSSRASDETTTESTP